MTQNVILESILEEQRQAREDRKKDHEEIVELRSAVSQLVKEGRKTNESIQGLVDTITLAEAHRAELGLRVGQVERNQIRIESRMMENESQIHKINIQNNGISVRQKGMFVALGTVVSFLISGVYLVISKFGGS